LSCKAGNSRTEAASRARSRVLHRTQGACVAIALTASAAAAQEIGRLYATRPPPGSAFLRIVNAEPTAAAKLNGSDLPIDKNAVASRYRVVRANEPIRLTVDGVATEVAAKPQADQFYTIAIARDGKTWSSTAIDEGQGSANDLKAQLRFFNLSGTCDASLRIADGPVVFQATAFGHFNSRTINPVQARLEATCNGASAALTLPQLRSGDHFSLFLVEIAGKPALVGQFDETEPYRDQ
ncbi:MAG: alginate O-acetyltransferase AlgF, partial [Rhizobium sp.]|nr:alginate O-acetyltransferase AlgF [Rhizobium sp.]